MDRDFDYPDGYEPWERYTIPDDWQIPDELAEIRREIEFAGIWFASFLLVAGVALCWVVALIAVGGR